MPTEWNNSAPAALLEAVPARRRKHLASIAEDVRETTLYKRPNSSEEPRASTWARFNFDNCLLEGRLKMHMSEDRSAGRQSASYPMMPHRIMSRRMATGMNPESRERTLQAGNFANTNPTSSPIYMVSGIDGRTIITWQGEDDCGPDY